MTSKAGLEEELRRLDAVAPAGYCIGLHMRFAAPLKTYQTVSRAWVDRYLSQAYGMRDPMIAWAFSTEGMARWSEIDIPDPFHIMEDAARHGLKYGVQFSCGPLSSRTVAAITRQDREFTDEESANAMSIVRRLHALSEPPEALTNAQVAALRLIAAGDRHTAAAVKLGISESALKARLTAARQRLMARTTAEAIQRAKDLRLL